MRRILTLCAVFLLMTATAAFSQQKKGDTGTRSVQGVVSNPDDSPAVGAVVQLENAKTQQVRSFVTKADGAYKFYESTLRPRGFKLSASVVDFPGGKPGDIGFFLRW